MADQDRHDRTWRFMRTAFPWAAPPSIESLRETAEHTEVALAVGADVARFPQAQLTVLALVNILGRLPVRLILRAPDALGTPSVPPYQGEALHGAVDDIASRLDTPIDLTADPRAEAAAVEITTPQGGHRYHFATDGWSAYMGMAALVWSDVFNPVSAYFVACMIGGEVLRAWARLLADVGAGQVGPSFIGRTRVAADRSINLWAPGTSMAGPAADASRLPPIDWAGAGAVNQATLAVLAAMPAWSPRGRVVDPKPLDLPDLNRSPLSFMADVGESKAFVATRMLPNSSLGGVCGSYPDDLGDRPARWIVAGTDDPVARSDIQRLWPERLIVTATENVFGYVAWHAKERDDLACAGCGPTGALDGDEPIPTSAPTSAAAGVVTAATLLRLGSNSDVPGRTDLLTLRLDSAHALEGSNPPPTRGCAVCRTRPRTGD